MTDAGSHLRSRTAGIVGAIACTTIFAMTIGLSYPLLSFLLKAQGYSEAAIGLNAAMTPLGLLVAAPFYPRLIDRFGGWQVAVIGLGVAGLLILLMGLTGSFVMLMLLRFLLGVFDVGVFIISETWINQLAERQSRGRIIGLYATSISAGFGMGPMILAATGPEGLLPFALGTAICGAAMVVVHAIRRSAPTTTEEQPASALSFVRLAPTLLLAVAVVAVWEAASLSLFPVFALAYGYSPGFASVALSVCIMGNTFLQIPIGWIADRSSRRAVLISCALIGTGGAAALPWVVNTPALLLPALFFWGAAVGGLYTMSMTELGDRFTGAQLVAGNAAFAAAFGVGGLLGGPSVGLAMKLGGPDAYGWTLAAVLLATAAVALLRRRPVPAPG